MFVMQGESRLPSFAPLGTGQWCLLVIPGPQQILLCSKAEYIDDAWKPALNT